MHPGLQEAAQFGLRAGTGAAGQLSGHQPGEVTRQPHEGRLGALGRGRPRLQNQLPVIVAVHARQKKGFKNNNKLIRYRQTKYEYLITNVAGDRIQIGFFDETIVI